MAAGGIHCNGTVRPRAAALGRVRAESYNTFRGMFRLSNSLSVLQRNLNIFVKATRRGELFFVFLLAIGNAFGLPAVGSRPTLSARRYLRSSMVFPVSSPSLVGGAYSAAGKAAGMAGSDERVEAIQSAIGGVHTPNLQALAKALGLRSEQIGVKAFEDSEIGLEPIRIIKGSSVPAAVAKWRPSPPGQNAQMEAESNLYLLCWDGRTWQASYLTPAINALTVQVLPVTENATPLIAVVLFRGMTAVPYPVIFRFRDFHASVAWDSRAPTSLYSGYDYGSIRFEEAQNADVPVMIAAGVADPGLLVFPSSSEQSGRGFQVATAYAWQNNAYVPIQTGFTHNRDYTLYRFISALHLHEYKTAYSLIAPKQFLGTDKPSLKLFRARVMKTWPEFTDDQIFEVPSGPEIKRGSHVFTLKLKDGKMYVYHPSFTSGPKYLLTGLKRTEIRK